MASNDVGEQGKQRSIHEESVERCSVQKNVQQNNQKAPTEFPLDLLFLLKNLTYLSLNLFLFIYF